MIKRTYTYLADRRIRTLFVLLAAFAGVAMVMVSIATAGTDASVSTKTLDRDLDPVIVTGDKVAALFGSPVDQLFVYTYTNGTWWQIPTQVDEVTLTGDYTTTEDYILDGNDEIVFMAMDLGDQAPADEFITSTLSISDTWYMIEVVNPIDPVEKGWAYIVRSTMLTPDFTADYVDYDLGLHRLKGSTYELGLAIPHLYFDYLTLHGGDDILDRTKTRLCFRGFDDPGGSLCILNEDNLPGDVEIGDDLIKDGVVRVIARGGKGIGYHSKVDWTRPISWKQTWGPHMRFSIDFNEEVDGATHYNAVVPGGLPVDGFPDTVPETPVSSWFQLSSVYGTLIQVGDTTSMGGIQYNYYEDESIFKSSDTGDGERWGETGVFVEEPSKNFTYAFTLYILPSGQPNVGATYEAFFEHPLSVGTFLRGKQVKVYLPLIVRYATMAGR